MSYWFTSDHHFGHKNIIKFCNRPFSTVEEMDAAMTARWNQVVKPDDVVYHLGDFTLNNDAQVYWQYLNGQVFVLSYPYHHDKRWLARTFDNDFAPINQTINGDVRFLPGLDVLDQFAVPIVLCHYEMNTWDRSHYGAWHLFGHDHRKQNIAEENVFKLNVGVDAWDFYPVKLDTILIEMEARGWYAGWSKY